MSVSRFFPKTVVLGIIISYKYIYFQIKLHIYIFVSKDLFFVFLRGNILAAVVQIALIWQFTNIPGPKWRSWWLFQKKVFFFRFYKVFNDLYKPAKVVSEDKGPHQGVVA